MPDLGTRLKEHAPACSQGERRRRLLGSVLRVEVVGFRVQNWGERGAKRNPELSLPSQEKVPMVWLPMSARLQLQQALEMPAKP